MTTPKQRGWCVVKLAKKESLTAVHVYFAHNFTRNNPTDYPFTTDSKLRELCICKVDPSSLGGVVVNVLATGPKSRGFDPGQGDGFLGDIKIRSIPSFG
jgi:hypothetical protein